MVFISFLFCFAFFFSVCLLNGRFGGFGRVFWMDMMACLAKHFGTGILRDDWIFFVVVSFWNLAGGMWTGRNNHAWECVLGDDFYSDCLGDCKMD